VGVAYLYGERDAGLVPYYGLFAVYASAGNTHDFPLRLEVVTSVSHRIGARARVVGGMLRSERDATPVTPASTNREPTRRN
jgi:hypothetical protein